MEDINDELPAELSAEVNTKPRNLANPEVIVTDEDGNHREENDRSLHIDGNPNTNGLSNGDGERKAPPPPKP